MRLHELTEREWKLVEPHTEGRLGTGRDNRLFVNAVLYCVRTGVAWRDLPERFGPWNTVARRFRRWAQAGVWETLFQADRNRTTPGYSLIPPRPRPTKPRPGKKSTPAAEALSRSRGGFCTKVHAVVDALGNCLHLGLTPGSSGKNLYANRNKVERFFGRLKGGLRLCHPLRENRHLLFSCGPPARRPRLNALDVYTA